jgi:polyhydroxybutyrate depolymerase
VERIALEVGGTRREYLLFVPRNEGFTSPARLPLVVFLHGTGATAEWADDETGWSRLAAREGFALALPQALSPHPDQPPKFLTNPPRWQDATGTEDVTFLAAAMNDAASRAGADPSLVFVCGFSNGAAMAFRVAAELAERVAAIAPVAGHCRLPDPRPARPVPTLYVVGSADPLIPLHGGDVRNPWEHRYVRRPPIVETLEKWARAIGCEPVPRKDEGGRTSGKDEGGRTSGKDEGGRMKDEQKTEPEAGSDSSFIPHTSSLRVDTYPGPVPFRSVVIEGLGHHWPGGKGQFNHRIAGPPSDTANGTELVWEFFKQQM